LHRFPRPKLLPRANGCRLRWKLKAGEFVWEPERAPEGPVLIVVSVPDQVAYVYRNGVRIARTTVSTGRPGHPTPTGVFNILEKEKDHESTIYKGAEMPFMERLEQARIPSKFIASVGAVVQPGTTMIITDEAVNQDTQSSPNFKVLGVGEVAAR
jgi:hypothetical protein